MKLKISLVWMCIVSLTCCVIFFPVLISRNTRNRLPEKKNFWYYAEKPNQRLTDVEFAGLFSGNYFQTTLDSYRQISAAEFDRSAAETMLQEIMPNDTDFLNEICTIMDTGDPIDFNANTVFILRDGYPEALRLINAAYEKDGRFFSIYFEEKTMTLISLNYNGSLCLSTDFFPTAALLQYFFDRLQLPPGRVMLDYGDQYLCAEILTAEQQEKIASVSESDL